MDDDEKKQPLEAISERAETSQTNIDHEHAQLHKISPEDDARVRRKIDMVVLPMVIQNIPPQSFNPKLTRADVSRVLHPIPG